MTESELGKVGDSPLQLSHFALHGIVEVFFGLLVVIVEVLEAPLGPQHFVKHVAALLLRVLHFPGNLISLFHSYDGQFTLKLLIQFLYLIIAQPKQIVLLLDVVLELVEHLVVQSCAELFQYRVGHVFVGLLVNGA